LKETLSISAPPARTAISLPVSTSHTRAVWSSNGVTIRPPSGLNPASERPLRRPANAAIALPLSCRAVTGGRNDSSTIGAECSTFHLVLMGTENDEFFARLAAPNPGSFTARDNASAVWAEGSAPFCRLKHENHLAVFAVPNPCGVVIGGRND